MCLGFPIQSKIDCIPCGDFVEVFLSKGRALWREGLAACFRMTLTKGYARPSGAQKAREW
jgi:hypothetical protein